MSRRGQLSERFSSVTLEYRWATQADYNDLGDVMFDAVRHGPSRYDEAQRKAWVPEPRHGHEWNNRLSEQSIAVAVLKGKIVGMMSLSPAGYLDLAFIRPAHQGSGVFRKLFSMLLQMADEQNIAEISVHASLMAEPAFSAMGFEIVKKEIVALGDQDFERFAMRLSLAK